MNILMQLDHSHRLLYQGWAKGLSFALATPLALILMIHPALFLDQQGHYSHGTLSLVMLGISAGFIHGVSFLPKFWLWRFLFSPYMAWSLMLVGYMLLWQIHS